MATVPVLDAPRVGANSLPATAIRENDTAAIGGMAAQQAERLGGAMQSAGQVGMQIATDMQQQANQVLINGALDAVKSAQLDLTYGDNGYANIKGAAAFKRDSGKPLADEYGEMLQSRIDKISAGLGNDAQRAAFKQHAQGMVMSMRERATVHEKEEFKNHSLSVAEGIQATALRDIGLNWNDPQAVQNAVERIKAETYRQAQLLGKSGEWQEAQARKMTSNGHKVALLAALENNDPSYADGYLKKFSDQMDADDILTVRGHITREMNIQVGTQQADKVFAKFAPKIEGGPMAILESITMGTESGGRRYGKDGALLESPKGAKGEMQVMDKTNLDPGFGVRPAKDDSPDERARVGRDYLAAMLSRYEGDPAKMWAAYNAGPGALDKALKAAEKNQHLGKLGTLAQNDPSIARTWLDYLPDETQNYVAKNIAALDKAQKGGQVIAKPTLQDIHQELAADPLLASDPERMKIAMGQVKQRYSDMESALKQRGEETKVAIQQAMIENGGDWNKLSPSLRAQATQYIPGEVDNLKKFNTDRETNLPLYNDLTAHPERLRAFSDVQFNALRGELSETDFKHFANERAKALGNSTGTNGPGDLNSAAIKQALDSRIRILGMDPTPKDDTDDAGRVGALRKFVDDYFYTAQRESGKKLSDSEVSAHLDALFAKNVAFRGMFDRVPDRFNKFGWGKGGSKSMLSMTAGDIPGDTRKELEKSFKSAGVDDPTDAQILNAYWTLKVARK